ncbi:hypothetical protein RRG08_063256 [Elysia crispata]|uniref:Uncharacterized protein n=1 Tax=Elysia crispata TaxID=231223 RepID=A0AAE0XPI6_9GAST|nr:hypothetical protein RRG08_063256 [Elysia crispata]
MLCCLINSECMIISRDLTGLENGRDMKNQLAMSKIMRICAVLVTLLHDSVASSESVQTTTVSEVRLLNDLFSGYDKRVRATSSPDDTTHVSIGLRVRTLMLLDEHQHFMNTVSSLLMSWNDRRLSWDRSQYDFVDQVKVPASEIWKPDITPFTSIEENSHLDEINAIVYATGDIHWNPILRLQSPCKINLERFPFDEKNCSIDFASYLYHGSHINITYYGKKESTLKINGVHLNPMWQVANFSAQITHHNYYCCNETYPVMKFKFLFRRKAHHYYRVMVTPALLLGALVPLSFLLPPDCKERITAEMIIVFSLLLLLGKFYDTLPMDQGEIPALAKYYLVTLLLDVLALVGSTVVLNLHNRGPRRAKVPDTIRRVFLGGLRWIACLKNHTYASLDDIDLDAFAMRGIHKSGVSQTHEQHSSDNQGLRTNSTNVDNDMEELRTKVNALSNRFSIRDSKDEVLNEWQQVVLVLDRLLFLFFPLAFFVSSMLILA